MAAVNEATCTWPNGERRDVMVMSNDGQNAKVIWNERVDTASAAVTGFEETVPSAWLTCK